MVHTDSDTENGHGKARWVHLWSVHGYTVNLTLDVSRRLKVDHFGHWYIFLFECLALRWIRISVYPSQCQAFLFIVYTGIFFCDGHAVSAKNCRKTQKSQNTKSIYSHVLA